MSIVKKIFDHFWEVYKHKSRIKNDKEAIQSTANYQINCIRDIKLDKKAAGRSTPNTSTGEDMQGWRGSAIEFFKDNIECPELAIVMDKYTDLMVVAINQGEIEYPHSCNIKVLFVEAMEELFPEDALEMAFYISRSETFKKSLPINDINHNVSVIRGLIIMALKCPVEEKMKFYSTLDSAGILHDCFSHGPVTPDIASFVVSAFRGVDTPAALNMLESSSSWRRLPKDQNLHSCLVNRDERLLPAMKYSS